MNLYVDESGSINNHNKNNKYFVIAIIYPINPNSLKRAYKRFVSSNIETLKMLDKGKNNPQTGKTQKSSGKMFADGKFRELKGAQFDREMKLKFIEFFSRKQNFEIYYIKISNAKLTDKFCENTARAFNYTLRQALEYFISQGYFPQENCELQLDERNERTEARYFLENYLNTELSLGGVTDEKFKVSYFDSADNLLIQIADVFANLYYSHLQTGAYETEINDLKSKGFIKAIFEFP